MFLFGHLLSKIFLVMLGASLVSPVFPQIYSLPRLATSVPTR
jgi:hypothetical protein